MAINTSRAWTGSTIAPQSRPATPPATTPGSNIPPAVTGAQNNLNQQMINTLLNNLFGGGGGRGGTTIINPPMSLAPQQGQAINFAIQQIAAENWARQREKEIRAFEDPRARSGFEGVSPMFAPMGGGFLPVESPVMNTFLSNQRLLPAVTLGTAAASFGSGGGAPRTSMAPMGGWTPPAFGF